MRINLGKGLGYLVVKTLTELYPGAKKERYVMILDRQMSQYENNASLD